MSSVREPNDKNNGSPRDMPTTLEKTYAPEELDPTVANVSKVGAVNNRPVFKPSREFLLSFVALCTIALAIAFDATSLSVALPIISSAIGGTALEAFWSGTSFLLASTVLQPTVASLSDIFGRKYMIYLTAAIFGAGSLVAALANSFTVILVGRTIQGVGGGGLLALSEVVVTDLVPLAFRGNWLSLLSGVWSIGTVTGPLIGAGFAQNVTWRWIFYINLPVIGLGITFVVIFLHQEKIPGHITEKLGRFDWIGCIVFTASLTSFLFGLTTGGVMYEWSSWRVLLPLMIGPMGLLAFGWYEVKLAREPIINKGLFNNRDMIVTYIMTILHGMVLWSLLYFMPLYYQGVKLYSPIISAVALLPETLTVTPAASVVGIVGSLTGHYRWSLSVGWILTTIGCGLLLLLKPETSIAAWIWLNVPVGIGTGMLFPGMALSIQAACEPILNGQAAAFFSFLRTLGQSIGVAVSGVIFQNVFKRKLLDIVAFAPVADQFSRDATIVVEIIRQMPVGPDRHNLIVAYNDSLLVIWISMLAFSAFSTVLSLAIKGYTLNQEHVTRQGLVQQNGKNETQGEG